MRLLRKLTFPISLLYGLGVYLRNWLYDLNILGSKSFQTPIISVGNLSTGGTGKTPMVEWLIRQLSGYYNLAVVSRGYRRKSRGMVRASRSSTAAELGDEPYQIHLKFPGVEICVDANRRRAISILEAESNPDYIILDDAHQHRKVQPTFSILLTAYSSLYSDDYFLPTGNLRDSKRQAKRADLIIVTKCPPDINRDSREGIIDRLKPSADQQVLFSSLDYNRQLKGNADTRPLDSLRGKRLTLVTGIANPAPLVTFLKSNGLEFDHMRFPDHHRFSDIELERLGQKELVLTTEKDYARIGDKLKNLLYIEVSHKFLNDGGTLLTERIKSLRN